MNNRSTDHKELPPKESVRMREATGSAAEVKTAIRTSEVLNSPSLLSLDSFTINLPTQIELGISRIPYYFATHALEGRVFC